MPDARLHPTPQQLAAYSLGKLIDAEAIAVSEHVSVCDACQQQVENQPPDSFMGKLRDAKPRTGSMAPTILPSLLPTSGPLPPQDEARPADDVPPELAASSKFSILGKLGQGGMGAVYKAKHNFLGELVAIKVMNAAVVENPDARSRFLREMQATAKLNHPHIVRALDAEQTGDLLVLVVEYVSGRTLDRLVKERGPLPVTFSCQCIMQAALGLQHAHEKGMVHRDIKPANLMVAARDKQVKVLDFGLARGPRTMMDQPNQTQARVFMGTPEYVAPEQATDARSADIRADIYSLGCTLYFLLAGRPPFQAGTVMATIVAQIQDDAQPLSEVRKGVSAELETVVAKMMAKNPEDRYQTPGEVAEALQPFTVKAARTALVAPVQEVAASSETEEIPFESLVLPPVNASRPSAERQGRGKKRGPAGIVYAAVAAGVAAVLIAGMALTPKTSERNQVQPQPADPGKTSLTQGNQPITQPVKEESKRPAAIGTPAPSVQLSQAITNSIGMKLVRIPAGKFQMGSPINEQDRSSDEQQHEVEITKAFYMGVYTVTQAEYKNIRGGNPSYFSASGGGKEMVKDLDTRRFPVETVSWEDAVKFCEKLSERSEEKAQGRTYRLPTEAEWEYACRAGTKTAFHSGGSLASTQANFNGNFPYGGAEKGIYLTRTCKVGSYRPNAFGLYDMHGNVWQWCNDWYGKDYYQSGDNKDPQGENNRGFHVLRGGGWGDSARDCRAADRVIGSPGIRIDSLIGFRVVCGPARTR